MMTFVVVASYPSRRRGDAPILRGRRRRTSGRVIGVSGGRRRWFNHRHLVSRLSCGAETTLKGRYLNHFFVSHKVVFYSRLEYTKELKSVGKKEKNENEGERKVLSEGKIRFQKQKKSNFSAFLLPDCFSDKSISKVLLLFKHRTTTR